MKSNLKFFLALGDTKLIMLNSCGKNIFYSRTSQYPLKKDLAKIASVLESR